MDLRLGHWATCQTLDRRRLAPDSFGSGQKHSSFEAGSEDFRCTPAFGLDSLHSLCVFRDEENAESGETQQNSRLCSPIS